MNFSFQTVLVGSVVTVVHVAAILVMKPATLEASKFFNGLELDGFVEGFLVKQGEGQSFSTPGGTSPPRLAGVEEILSEPSEPVLEAEAPSPRVESPGKFMNLEREIDSIKAVTDVRVFAGRIDEPELEEYSSAGAVAESDGDAKVTPAASVKVTPMPEPLSAPKQDVRKESAASAPPAGPHQVRAIAPLSRS